MFVVFRIPLTGLESTSIFPQLEDSFSFGHTPATRLAWKEQTGIAVGSWWEVAKQLMLQFGDVLPFIRNWRQEDARGATLRQIDEMLSDPQANAQLAATVDAGKPMVESTYILEGDETLAWKCYEQLLYIQNRINTTYFPNITAISRELSGGQPPLAQQWYQAGLAVIQPG